MAARHQQSTGLPESSRGQSGAGKVQIIPISSLLRAFFLPSWGDFFCRESVNFGAEQTTLQRYNESIAVYAFFTKNFKNQKSPYLTALSSYLLVLTSQFLALSSQLLVLTSYFLVLSSYLESCHFGHYVIWSKSFLGCQNRHYKYNNIFYIIVSK